MEEMKSVTDFSVGVVGLGLMGCSIATCLLIAGHTVMAVAPVSIDMQNAGKRIKDHLSRSQQEGLINESPEIFLKKLFITEDFSCLKDCKIVIECTLENLEIKKAVYQKIEAVINNQAILASNTSATPNVTASHCKVLIALICCQNKFHQSCKCMPSNIE